MDTNIKTADDFREFVESVESQPGYRRPLAFGIGIANVSDVDGFLDAFFPFPNFMANYGTAAVIASVAGHLSGTSTYCIGLPILTMIRKLFLPFKDDGLPHGNIDAIDAIFDVMMGFVHIRGINNKLVVVSFIDQPEFDQGPVSVCDAYLRLHLLSHRLVKPNGIKLDNIFGKLPNNVWTNEGPMAPADFQKRQLEAMMQRHPIHVFGVDKFPSMLDYVVPSGVRIADGARVRLGAYLGDGTTVMHEGFCNFNAGTLGTSMVEGRISAGVVVGDKSDIGGGASIMGTLSGGGKEKITIGRGCLIGANAGTGISLGDLCVIEAGLYVTGGMRVLYNNKIMKAHDLSGKDGLTFFRNSTDGWVEVLDKPNKVELNEVLHKN